MIEITLIVSDRRPLIVMKGCLLGGSSFLLRYHLYTSETFASLNFSGSMRCWTISLASLVTALEESSEVNLRMCRQICICLLGIVQAIYFIPHLCRFLEVKLKNITSPSYVPDFHNTLM